MDVKTSIQQMSTKNILQWGLINMQRPSKCSNKWLEQKPVQRLTWLLLLELRRYEHIFSWSVITVTVHISFNSRPPPPPLPFPTSPHLFRTSPPSPNSSYEPFFCLSHITYVTSLFSSHLSNISWKNSYEGRSTLSLSASQFDIEILTFFRPQVFDHREWHVCHGGVVGGEEGILYWYGKSWKPEWQNPLKCYYNLRKISHFTVWCIPQTAIFKILCQSHS